MLAIGLGAQTVQFVWGTAAKVKVVGVIRKMQRVKESWETDRKYMMKAAREHWRLAGTPGVGLQIYISVKHED